MRASRDRRGPDRYLTWKAALLALGAGALLVGIRWELNWLRWSAIVFLLIAFVLRFLPQAASDDDP